MNKPLKISLITIGSLVGLVLFAVLFVLLFGGPIGRKVVEKHSPQWVGRQILLDDARINLFAGSVDLYNVRMLEADNATDFVRFDSLYAQIKLLNLLKKDVHLNHIWLTGFDGTVINRDSCFNFQDIIDHFSSDEEKVEEPKDTTATPWQVELYDIRIRRSSLAYVDEKRNSDWGMEHIDIDIPGLEFGHHRTKAGVTLDFPNNAGSLALNGHYDMGHNTFSLDLDLDSVKADMALPFVKDYLNVSKLGSRITGCILAEGDLARIAELGVRGQLRVTDTDICDLDGKTLLTLQNLSADVDTIDLGEMDFCFNEVSVSGLNATFARWDDHNTFSHLFVEGDSAAVKEETLAQEADSAAPKTMKLLVKNANISDVNIKYEDYTLAEKFTYAVNKVSARAKDLTLTGPNHVMMNAQLPNGGSVMATYGGGLNLHKGSEKLNITVKNLQLKDFSPWCEAYTASPIDGGVLSMTSDTRLNDGALKSSNLIDIYQMAIGQKVNPSEAPYKAIPVKLAVGILTDMDGKIELDVPVSGNIDDPKFSYSKLIWKAIGNILLKATASPWVALGKALGIGGEDLSTIEINVLQPDFTSEQYAKLDQLVEIVKSQDELNLCLTQQFEMKSAIADQKLFDRKRAYYESENGAIERPTLAEIKDINAIKTTDKGYKAYVSEHPEEVSDSIAREEVLRFAEMRQRTLLAYLVTQQSLPEDRVEVKLLPEEQLEVYSDKPMFEVTASSMQFDLGDATDE